MNFRQMRCSWSLCALALSTGLILSACSKDPYQKTVDGHILALCEEAFSDSNNKIEKLLAADLKKIETCSKEYKKDPVRRDECLKGVKIFTECRLTQMNALAQEASDADPQAQATAACLDRNVLRAQYGQRISPYASCPKLTESASLSFDTKEACVQGLQKKYERAPQSGAGVEKLEEPICTYRLLEVATCSLAASREYAASEGADPNFDPCLVNNGIAGKQIPAQAQELIRNTCRNHLAAYQGACFQRSKGELSEMGQAKKDKFGRPIK